MAIEGIDVHDAQGGVDWHRVANDGKKFAFVRGVSGGFDMNRFNGTQQQLQAMVLP